MPCWMQTSTTRWLHGCASSFNNRSLWLGQHNAAASFTRQFQRLTSKKFCNVYAYVDSCLLTTSCLHLQCRQGQTRYSAPNTFSQKCFQYLTQGSFTLAADSVYSCSDIFYLSRNSKAIAFPQWIAASLNEHLAIMIVLSTLIG